MDWDRPSAWNSRFGVVGSCTGMSILCSISWYQTVDGHTGIVQMYVLTFNILFVTVGSMMNGEKGRICAWPHTVHCIDS